MAQGPNTAATGWGGAINNQGQAAGTVKVAAVCAVLGGVVVQVSNSVVVAPGQHNGSALVCPAGHIATGGGFSAAEILPLIATVSTPLYNGYSYPAERESGEYAAPIGWFDRRIWFGFPSLALCQRWRAVT